MTTECWYAGDGTHPNSERGCVYDENGLAVAYVCGQSEDDSDTRLLAAAPTMLAALKQAFSWCNSNVPYFGESAESRRMFGVLERAIADAEGR